MINKGRKMSEFNDGTSKTAAISEVRNIEGKDTRGVLHFGAGVLYMHDFPPNYEGTIKERTRYCLNVDFAPCQQSSARLARRMAALRSQQPFGRRQPDDGRHEHALRFRLDQRRSVEGARHAQGR